MSISSMRLELHPTDAKFYYATAGASVPLLLTNTGETALSGFTLSDRTYGSLSPSTIAFTFGTFPSTSGVLQPGESVSISFTGWVWRPAFNITTRVVEVKALASNGHAIGSSLRYTTGSNAALQPSGHGEFFFRFTDVNSEYATNPTKGVTLKLKNVSSTTMNVTAFATSLTSRVATWPGTAGVLLPGQTLTVTGTINHNGDESSRSVGTIDYAWTGPSTVSSTITGTVYTELKNGLAVGSTIAAGSKNVGDTITFNNIIKNTGNIAAIMGTIWSNLNGAFQLSPNTKTSLPVNDTFTFNTTKVITSGDVAHGGILNNVIVDSTNTENALAAVSSISDYYDFVVTPSETIDNTVPPTISGSSTVGAVLSSTTGTWTPGDVTFARQWLRDGTAISGATASTYTLTSTDQDKVISLRVTASKTGLTSKYVYSLGKYIPAAPVVVIENTVAPSLTGDFSPGSTVTAEPGTWTPGDVTFARQWMRDGVNISGATGNTYTLTPQDLGKVLSVKVTASKSGLTSKYAYSLGEYIEPIPVVVIDNVAEPVVTGDSLIGSVLTCSAGTWDPEVDLAYQWYRDNSAIAGAVTNTHTTDEEDLETYVRCRVTASLSGSESVSVYSSGVFVEPEPVIQVVNLTDPSITGGSEVGDVITINPGSWLPSDVDYTYSWYRGSTLIAGQVGSTYTVQEADFGSYIRARVRASYGIPALTVPTNSIFIDPLSHRFSLSQVLDMDYIQDTGLLVVNFYLLNSGEVPITSFNLSSSLGALVWELTPNTGGVAVGGVVTGKATYRLTQEELDSGVIENTLVANVTYSDALTESVSVVSSGEFVIIEEVSFATLEDLKKSTLTPWKTAWDDFGTTKLVEASSFIDSIFKSHGFTVVDRIATGKLSRVNLKAVTCSLALRVLQYNLEVGVLDVASISEQAGPLTKTYTLSGTQSSPDFVLYASDYKKLGLPTFQNKFHSLVKVREDND